jgi:subfamily B ATP-binding cassette protein HlyB/CyaB
VIENSSLKFLSKNTIFSLIPEALDELSPFMEIELTTPGKVLFHKGDKLDSLIVPIQEPLSLVGEENVHLLVRGRALALTCLLRNTELPYDVKSEEFNKLVVLPRKYLMSYFERNSLILNYLMIMTESEPFRRLKHVLVEKGVSQDEIVKLANLVSDPIEFNPDYISETVLLIESGKLLIDSQVFTGELKGGEFICGFHAQNRPNPGYKVYGPGVIRKIDLQKARHLGLDKTILDYLGTDPWVQSVHVKKIRTEGITKIPNNELYEWNISNLGIDPGRFKLAESDWESIKETIVYLLESESIEPNRLLIENRLERTDGTICLSLIGEILESHGLLTQAQHWKNDYSFLKYPLLCLFGNRVILAFKLEGHYVCCFDSCQGYYKIAIDYLIQNSPDVVLTYKNLKAPHREKNEDLSSLRKKTFEFVWNVISTEKKTALRITSLTICTYILGAFTPKLNELLLDEVLKTEDSSTLTLCLSGLALIGFFTIVFEFLKNRLITKSSLSLDDAFTRFTYFRSQKLSSHHYAKLGSGGVMNRLMEMDKIRSFFSTETLNILFSIGSAVVFASMLAMYSGSLLFFVLGYFCLIFLILFYGRKYIYKLNLKAFEVSSKTNSFIGDSISNILAIKAFSASATVSKEWESLNYSLIQNNKQVAIINNGLDQLVELLGSVLNISIVWFCMSSLSTKGGLSFGQVFAIIQLVNQTISPMGNLVDFFSKIEDMKLSIDKVNDIILTEKTENTKAKHSINLSGKIKFDRVSFKYSDESPLVLKDVSLTIYPGQTVAIVGRSGSGKTTIANLIAKEVFPTAGRIYYDDVDSSFIDPDEVKCQVGYIQQNNQLFSGSIRSNVAFKDEAPDQARLDQAYLLSNSDTFLHSFPQFDDTYLAEGGLGLSGGQKQRLTMARTIYSAPRLMILDEATSALDSESEGVIIQKMIENKGSVTTIIIAHRLSTIRSADYVYVVDGGEIVQDGTHNDLILRDGVYKDLFQDQAS